MAGMTCVLGSDSARIPAEGILRSIDLAGFGNTEWFDGEESFFAVAGHKYDPPACSLHFEDADFRASFCGDIVTGDGIPWIQLKDSLRKGTFRDFSNHRGIFALMAEDRRTRKLHLISDQLSLYPLFYRTDGGRISASTSLATFCVLPDRPRFNRKWLYEYLFFNVPIGDTTYLEGVFKMPAASVLTIDLDTGRKVIAGYAGRLHGENMTLCGKEACRLAMKVAENTIPKYFAGSCSFAHGLTSGFDTNTILSYSPPGLRQNIVTFTYGQDDCLDVTTAVSLARRLGFRHRIIRLDGRFLERLPSLITESVYLSGGLDNINRASLPYVYSTISGWDSEIPTVISGINSCYAGGSRTIPRNIAMISSHIRKSFEEGAPVIDERLFRRMFGSSFNEFRDHIHSVFEYLRSEYGDMSDIRTYYSYETYEVLPKYFGGEFSTANNYLSLRMPLLDPDFIRLSYIARFGSPDNIHWKQLRLESRYALHALLIRHCRDFRCLAIHGLPLKAYSSNSTLLFNLYRLAYGGTRRVRSLLGGKRTRPPTEDWYRWYRDILPEKIGRMINGDSRTAKYLEPDYLEDLRGNGNDHLRKQIATVETILNLLDDSWKMPDTRH